jgi:hypothetical protein
MRNNSENIYKDGMLCVTTMREVHDYDLIVETDCFINSAISIQSREGFVKYRIPNLNTLKYAAKLITEQMNRVLLFT